MYLDTDIILAKLKADDWLARDVANAKLEDPITSAATIVEIWFVKEDDWSRTRLKQVPQEILKEGIGIDPLRGEDVAAAGALYEKYPRLNVFDSVHLGMAYMRNRAIISTDTLFPTIDDVTHYDPRDL